MARLADEARFFQPAERQIKLKRVHQPAFSQKAQQLLLRASAQAAQRGKQNQLVFFFRSMRVKRHGPHLRF